MVNKISIFVIVAIVGLGGFYLGKHSEDSSDTLRLGSVGPSQIK